MKNTPVSSTKKPHPRSNPCYPKGVFIIYPLWGRAENYEVLPFRGGGGRRITLGIPTSFSTPRPPRVRGWGKTIEEKEIVTVMELP